MQKIAIIFRIKNSIWLKLNGITLPLKRYNIDFNGLTHLNCELPDLIDLGQWKLSNILFNILGSIDSISISGWYRFAI